MDIFGQRIIERMMILPLGHKYSSQSPYIDLLNQFRTYLRDEQLLIVIGYSFRDLAVNNALLDRANKITSGDSTTNFKIVLVDERANDVINNNVPKELHKELHKERKIDDDKIVCRMWIDCSPRFFVYCCSSSSFHVSQYQENKKFVSG